MYLPVMSDGLGIRDGPLIEASAPGNNVKNLSIDSA